MQYSFHALTDTGLVRSNNEDALLFDEPCGVAVLADGMGGYNAGEIAAGMATAHLKTELVKWLSAESGHLTSAQMTQAIATAVEQANVSILAAADATPHYFGMGTTVVVGVFRGSALVLGHVGDSRCYRLRNGVLEQITKDHSMLQEQVDAGLLSVEQAAYAPGRNLLTRALGVDPSMQVETHEYEVKDADLYLMCSDGLSDMVTDGEIATVLQAQTELASMAQELVALANTLGGRDNVSVLLVRAAAVAGKPGLISRIFGKP